MSEALSGHTNEPDISGSINDTFSVEQRKQLAMAYADTAGFPVFELEPCETEEPSKTWRGRKHLMALGKTGITLTLALTIDAGAIDFLIHHQVPGEPPQEQSISLDNLPTRLPRTVLTRTQSVGSVINQVYNFSNFNNELEGASEELDGSGVQISPNVVLTAGHMLLSGKLVPLADRSTECNIVQFDKLLNGLIPDEQDAVKDSATYVYGDRSKIPDLAVLRTDDPWIKSDEHLKLRNTNLAIGQPLFFVNYEPTANHEPRNPMLFESQGRANYTAPAIYGGIYAGREPNGDLNVINGFKSYGSIEDNSSRGGASGGAVFDKDGNLVGLSIRSYNGTFTVSSLSSDFNVKLEGNTSNSSLTMSIVQPVDNQLVKQLTSELNPLPECEPF